VNMTLKQVSKITYPNAKICVGMDLTGTTVYMGSRSAYEQSNQTVTTAKITSTEGSRLLPPRRS
jgi:hypothetical protein